MNQHVEDVHNPVKHLFPKGPMRDFQNLFKVKANN